MAANPALEAEIDNNPNDVEAYYVYGDWLQAQSDPRGELVALQAAVLRAPGDDKLAQRAERYLKDHAAALLGDLNGYPKRALDWYCGFIRSVELELRGPQLMTALRALVRNPACRFLQSLRIADAPGVDPDAVATLLVVEKRPVTLADLRFARELSDASITALQAVFPHLDRSIDAEWRAILATVAARRRVDLRYDPKQLPRLEVAPGVGVAAPEPAHILTGLRMQLDKNKPVGIVAAMKRTFTADSLDRFAVGLGDTFEEEGQPAPMRWGFDAIGVLGGPKAVTWIGDRLGRWSHQRAGQGVALLAQIDSDVAVYEIFAMASDPAINRPRREEADRALARLASARNTDVERMLDRATPTTLAPRARAAVERRLRALMIDGRRMLARDFMRYFVTHPGIGPLVERLVWASFDNRDVELTFRSTGERVVDAEGNDVDLKGAHVGVVHPAELDPSDRERLATAWGDAFEALEIQPLFEQLARPVHELRDGEKGPALHRFKLRSVGFDQLRAGFEAREWAPQLVDSEWGTDAWTKHFGRDNVDVTAHIDVGAIGVVTLLRDGKPCAFEKLHAVTLSEILGEIEAATTRDKPAAKEVAVPAGIAKGTRVRITRGADFGKKGVVFWIGDGNTGARVGLRGEDGETYWADIGAIAVLPAAPPSADDDDDDDDEVEEPRSALDRDADAILATAPEPEPKVAKGMHVRWTKGRHSGTGVVFWIGKNKFGDGMRAGVKDDETRETVWVDVDDCTPDAKLDA